MRHGPDSTACGVDARPTDTEGSGFFFGIE